MGQSRNKPDEPWLTLTMEREPGPDRVAGSCAACGKAVFEDLRVLDDAYNVYWGVCPHCGAANALDMSGRHGGRGYSSQGMHLVLPTKEEAIMNGLPAEWPTQGWDRPENEGKTKEELIALYR
ncbi:MAG: hypothetical protein C4551_02385 [Bacillota bacterium]|nr:MAG: hypothetical protein C4551_02385 [Bacillota bacterium]